MGPILNGSLSEVIGLRSWNIVPIAWAIVWDPNKATDIEEWPIGGCCLLRFYLLYIKTSLNQPTMGPTLNVPLR